MRGSRLWPPLLRCLESSPPSQSPQGRTFVGSWLPRRLVDSKRLAVDRLFKDFRPAATRGIVHASSVWDTIVHFCTKLHICSHLLYMADDFSDGVGFGRRGFGVRYGESIPTFANWQRLVRGQQFFQHQRQETFMICWTTYSQIHINQKLMISMVLSVLTLDCPICNTPWRHGENLPMLISRLCT